MAVLSKQEIEDYLAEPHVAQLATLQPDGRPHMAPVWYLAEERRALVMAYANAVKVRNIRRNPVVALSIATGHGPTGLQLGPFSGKCIADTILGHPPEIDLTPFHFSRFPH